MRILIVDDSRAMRMIVRRTLRNAGYEKHPVTEASNGKEALQVLKVAPQDLILADWNMPEMNGLELMTSLRAAGNRVKFGFITTEGSPEKTALAMEGGALFLLPKPFTVEELQEKLGALLA
jgi:two-component system chemotaxis response regulator CheY